MPDTTENLHEELERAERAFSRLSLEWDDADGRVHDALLANGFRYDQVPTDLWKKRAAVAHARSHAHYRILLAEFALGRRSIEPRHPDDGGESPFESKPYPPRSER